MIQRHPTGGGCNSYKQRFEIQIHYTYSKNKETLGLLLKRNANATDKKVLKDAQSKIIIFEHDSTKYWRYFFERYVVHNDAYLVESVVGIGEVRG